MYDKDFIINYQGSMTKLLKNISNNLSIELLYNQIQHDVFYRNIALKLDDNLIMLATSSASISSIKFFNLLKNANTTPIGEVLFAKQSTIIRSRDMQITTMQLSEISNPKFYDYLNNLNYIDNTIIIKRESVFIDTTNNDDKMYLFEYILPTIELLVK